ncbi:MAG TPA: regulatory protein RecX [bacterium]|nr:regulatory protein RecX [bacterium]
MIQKNSSDIKELIRFALKLLARRDHFEIEIKNRLKDRGATKVEMEQVVEYLNKFKYINDQKTLGKYIAEMARKGKGVNYLKKKLYEKGCSDLLRDAERLYAPSIEESAAINVCSKLKNEDAEKIRKKLNSSGFSYQTISRVLKYMKKNEINEDSYDI